MGEELSKYHYKRAIFGRLWPKIESWLNSFTILRGSGPVLLKKPYIFVIFEGGGVWTPWPPPPWIRTCTTCLTPVQVNILVSDDSLTMYDGVFTWVETRAKSELRVRFVPLNMLKLSSFSFYWRRFRRSSSF